MEANSEGLGKTTVCVRVGTGGHRPAFSGRATPRQSRSLFGTDVSHDNTMVLVRGLVFIACGLLLATASYMWKRRYSLLVGASSVLYLVSWFPFRSAYQHGLIAVQHSVCGGDESWLSLTVYHSRHRLADRFLSSLSCLSCWKYAGGLQLQCVLNEGHCGARDGRNPLPLAAQSAGRSEREMSPLCSAKMPR